MFDLENAEDRSFAPIPDGWHPAIVTDVKWHGVDTDATRYQNKFQTCELTWQIIGGTAEGRKVWQNVNLNHPNKEWAGWAASSMKEIVQAVGDAPVNYKLPENYPGLVGKRCDIFLKTKKGKTDPSKLYQNVSAARPSEGGAASASPATATQQGGAQTPWSK